MNISFLPRSLRRLAPYASFLVLIFATFIPSEIVLAVEISDIQWDASTYKKLAPGSDNWPMTWASDGHQYTSFGDGGGFGGTNNDGRASLGYARVEGGATSYTGFNVWGGKGGITPTFNGKSYSIISVGGVLYSWVGTQDGGAGTDQFKRTKLYTSSDFGRSWKDTGQEIVTADFDGAFSHPNILNFGKDYANARDTYVYTYWVGEKPADFSSGNNAYLTRVPVGNIANLSKYEIFTGLNASGAPTWSANFNNRKPAYAGKVWWTFKVVYIQGLKKYILINVTDGVDGSNSTVDWHQADAPWGPWKKIKTFSNWAPPRGSTGYTFFFDIPTKWQSTDGKNFTMVFTGTGPYDAWNTVRGTFTTASTGGVVSDLPHKGDFLTAGCLSHEFGSMTSAQRSDCLSKIKARNYTHFYLYAYNENDYGGPSFDYYADPQGFKALLQQIINAGLKPVVWLNPDDAPINKARSNDVLKTRISTLVSEIDGLVSSYVLGLELDEYWDVSKVDILGNHLNSITNKPIAVHQLPGKWNYCKSSWCDYMILQYGFGLSELEIKTMTLNAISDLKKPVVAGEYNVKGQESLSITLGNVAVSAGASGFGNGGTSGGSTTPPPTPTTCTNTLTSSTAIPTGYGASYNPLTSAREYLIQASCTTGTQATVTVGNGNSTTYVYNKGYYYSGTTWTPYTLTCASGALIGGAWCPGRATAVIPLPQNPQNVIAYTCQYTNSTWKCGCRDATCSTPYWQLQRVQR